MSNHKEDYDNVPDNDFDLIPSGPYPVRVLNATVGPSKSSSFDVWCLDLEITGDRFAGRRLWLYISMKEEAKGVRKGVTKALGITTKPVDLIDDVKGRKAIAQIYHEEWNGKTREKVKYLKPIEQVTPGQAKLEEAADEFNGDEVVGEDSPF